VLAGELGRLDSIEQRKREVVAYPMPNSKPSVVVACLGSSSTAGKGQAFNWIAVVQKRLGDRFDLRNFGVGGDLAYNALQRLPRAIASNPQKIVALIGANDVLAIASLKVRRFYRVFKRLPGHPSPEWFGTNLQAMVAQLKENTEAGIALCSLPPIGEDLNATDPLQKEINRQTTTLNRLIREVAAEEGVEYLDVHEAFAAAMKNTLPHPLTEFRFLSFYRDAFRTVVLGKSPDDISRLNGWEFHTDGVHLNSRGGLMIAKLVEDFVLRDIEKAR
jgi:lysophospholipase L1-like esterase